MGYTVNNMISDANKFESNELKNQEGGKSRKQRAGKSRKQRAGKSRKQRAGKSRKQTAGKSRKQKAGKSRWINHVKNYSKMNNISYKDALSSSQCKNSYRR